MTLSDSNLRRLKERFGDTWSDAEYRQIYVDMDEKWDATMLELIDTLMIAGTRQGSFLDYAAGDIEEDRSKIFDQLKAMRDRYQKNVNEEQTKGGVRLSGIMASPPSRKRKPTTWT